MVISYPILPGRRDNETDETYFDRLLSTHVHADEGRYPVSTVNTTKGPLHRWHGGIHLLGQGEPIRAIADGTVVAFRFAKEAETYQGLGRYDTSFVLIHHETQTGERTTVAFYSLYMHLANRDDLLPDRYQQLPAWLRTPRCTPGPGIQKPANLKVWRKDVLGFAGLLYSRETCHFEVFTTDAQLQAFWRDSTSVATGAGSADFFGDAHFVIPADQRFVARHPRAASAGAHRIDLSGNNDFALPLGEEGQNNRRLFVSVRLDKGQRVATTYVAKADGYGHEQLGAPVVQPEYEYELYRLSTALYPDCPSAGFEWLRYGRVLSSDTTTRNENWQLVRFSSTAMGYIDLAPNSIVKLSDADFPFWQGWEKREEGRAANAQDGVCDDVRTIALCQATDADSLAKVRHLICKAPSEWDASDLAMRYASLRKEGGPLQPDQAWQDFEAHVRKMAFWEGAGIGDRNVWHWHPMGFVKHFARANWLTSDEFAQCIPRKNLHLSGSVFHEQAVATWDQARARASTWSTPINKAARKYCIASTRDRLVHFLAQLTEECGYYLLTVEGHGRGAPYAPFYGRGLIQLTHQGNYKKYGVFRAFVSPGSAALGVYQSIGWSPDKLLAASNQNFHADNCADSAGFYWVCPEVIATGRNVLATSDQGVNIAQATAASRATNGNVPVQNINGLATRLQALAFIRRTLMDGTPASSREGVSFNWRRTSSKETLLQPDGEPVLLPNGQPKKGFVVVAHNLSSPMNRQIP